MSKNLILDPNKARWTQIHAGNLIFFKNLASSVTKYHGQLSSCKISEKINDPILRKFRDGRTNRRANKSDFIGRCPTTFERPKDEEYVSNPSCSDPGQREKNNLDIYFHTSLWCLCFMNTFMIF